MYRQRIAGHLRPRPSPSSTPSTGHPTPAAEESGAPSDCPAFAEPVAEDASPLLYTPEQAAKLLQVRPSWLRRRAAARTIPCRFLGKHLRFAKQDIEEIAAVSRQPAHHLPAPAPQRANPARHA
ncbi:helix-turn-helix domain-containing protein [Lentzea atacamensis]|uniref:helix-turn-helix domain-containing protein n=1 Tax=Lentzea atacamensis TaxID=531938 RepID=UPI000D6B0EC8